MPANAPLSLLFDADALRPLITSIVREVLAQVETDRAKLDGKIAYSEAEAAGLLGLETHVLRDERRRGRIGASVGPGRRILYSKTDLLTYLANRRWSAD